MDPLNKKKQVKQDRDRISHNMSKRTETKKPAPKPLVELDLFIELICKYHILN
ncbi:MAG: hypothetical protein ACR2GN_06220 [Bacteroidia bacterium]